MKNIELTEDHKSKLLEMCKELFPEYKEIVFGNFFGNVIFSKNKIKNINWNNKKLSNTIFQMYWFELCSIKIVNELAWRNIKTDILADCEYEDFRMKLITEIFRDKYITETFHIIDYLYEEFKKLK